MKVRALLLGSTLSLVFASASFAGLVDSTFNFNASDSGGEVSITSPGGNGSYTDPNDPIFCVSGPGDANCDGSGLYGSITIDDVNPNESQINFNFYGSTMSGNEGDNFTITLSDFIDNVDGDTITGLTLDPDSGSLTDNNNNGSQFVLTSWDGTTATFTGTDDGNGFDAMEGETVTFDATLSSAPEPASLAMMGSGLLALGWALRKRRS